jgi:oligopeptide transport system substrate-binding protein
MRPTRSTPFAKLALVLAIAMLAMTAFACKSGSKQANEQIFRIRIAGDPQTLDPQLASFTDDISIVKQLYRGLFTYDEDLNVVPAVAAQLPTQENGGISSDALTYTITLRPDATWSDGQAVTAQDFVYAFQRLFDPNAGAQGYYFGFYTGIEGAMAAATGEASPEQVAVSATDDHTLVIKLSQPQPTLPTLLALWPASPLRQDLIEQNGAAWTDAGKLVTDGPFVLESFTSGDSVVLAANTNYWGSDEPTLDQLVYSVIPDDSAALVAYENGEIDLTGIPPGALSSYTSDPERVKADILATYAIQYNTTQAPLDNALVRQAFSRAIDREAYVTNVLQGVGQPAVSWVPQGMPGYNASIGSGLSFDPEAAKNLLSQAGYTDGAGFPTVKLMIADVADTRTAAEYFQQQLKDNLNVTVDIDAVDPNTFGERYTTGQFEMVWQFWFADYADPENWLVQQFGTGSGFNFFGYSNAQVDDLFSKASTELDQSARLVYYDQAQRIIINEDQVFTPIYYGENNFLLKINVAGVTTTALDAEPGDWFTTSIKIMDGAAPPASRPGY